MKQEVIDVLNRPSLFACRSSIEIEFFLNGMFYAELNHKTLSNYEYAINSSLKSFIIERERFNFKSTWGKFIYAQAGSNLRSLEMTADYINEFSQNIIDNILDINSLDCYSLHAYAETNELLPFLKNKYSSFNITNIHELWAFISGFDRKKRLLAEGKIDYSIVSYESGFKKHLSKTLHFPDRYVLPLMIECNSNSEEAGLNLFFEIFEEWKPNKNKKDQNSNFSPDIN